MGRWRLPHVGGIDADVAGALRGNLLDEVFSGPERNRRIVRIREMHLPLVRWRINGGLAV